MERDIKPNATYGEVRRTAEKMDWEKARGADYWEYRRKWVEYPQRFFVSDFPLHLDIETTNACNLKCPMCPRNSTAYRQKSGYMDFAFYCRLISEGAENGLCSVKLNYLGEPLMHKDVVRQVQFAKKSGIIEVMLNTNATLLTEELSRRLLDAGLDSIFFSVDSPYREKYNRIRVGADFDAVIKNIINFVDIRNKGGYRHVQARVSMVVMDNDPEELEDFKKFWLEYVDLVGFGEYINHDFDYGSKINPAFACAQPFQRMFVMWDGAVCPCCMDDKRNLVMGNAGSEALKVIWHNASYSRLREAMVEGRYYKIDLCRRCYVPWANIGGNSEPEAISSLTADS